MNTGLVDGDFIHGWCRQHDLRSPLADGYFCEKMENIGKTAGVMVAEFI